MSLVKNQKTGFSISDFKNSLQNSIYFVKLALAGFFFQRGFFFLFTLHRTKDELFDKLSKCIYSQTQTNILFFFVPGPGEYFKLVFPQLEFTFAFMIAIYSISFNQSANTLKYTIKGYEMQTLRSIHFGSSKVVCI